MSKMRILHLTEIEYKNIFDFIDYNISNYMNLDLLVMYMSPYTKYKIRECIGNRLPKNDMMNTLFGVTIITQKMRDDEIQFVEYDHKFNFDKDGYIERDIINTMKYINMLSTYGRGGFTKAYPTLPDKYIVNKDAAILFYGNNKTIVKRSKGDKVDPVKAFLWAYFLRNTGMSRTKANKYLQKVWRSFQEEIYKK